ncbi:MAG: CopL family metal-binding regulatory protein [Stenotrophomonas sp.]
MLRILLPLLLCLTLIASAIGSVWAATTMALPMAIATTAATPSQHDCHEMPTDGTGHTGQEHPLPASPCADGKHCDCTPLCSVLLPSVLPLPAQIPQLLAPLASAAGRASLAPERLHRPPIA